MAGVSCESVTKKSGKVIAVNDPTLEVKDKESLVLLGPSEGGKTTILRLLAGLVESAVQMMDLGLILQFRKPPCVFFPRERVSLAVVGDDDPGKRWVYLYLLAKTGDVSSQIADVVAGVVGRHRRHELPVTDDPSLIANQDLSKQRWVEVK